MQYTFLRQQRDPKFHSNGFSRGGELLRLSPTVPHIIIHGSPRLVRQGWKHRGEDSSESEGVEGEGGEGECGK